MNWQHFLDESVLNTLALLEASFPIRAHARFVEVWRKLDRQISGCAIPLSTTYLVIVLLYFFGLPIYFSTIN